MRVFLPAIVIALLCAGQTARAEGDGAPDSAAPAAPQLLAEVVERLPREPLQVSGEMIVRRRRGIVERTYRFDMALRWGAQPPTAVYTIRDAFGAPLEEMTVRRDAGETPQFSYAAGNPPASAPRPGLFDNVQATDLSWTDLALSFLWWPGGNVVATNEVRGRRCFVVEVPAPPAEQRIAAAETAGTSPAPPYRSARLWIDAELRMLLQAEGLDADGGAIRRLWIKGFKKVNETWMIKDLEVQQVNTGHRTKLVVLEVNGAST